MSDPKVGMVVFDCDSSTELQRERNTEEIIASYLKTLTLLDALPDTKQARSAKDLLEMSYARAIFAVLGIENVIPGSTKS